MKTLLIVLFCVTNAEIAFANEIDNLQTEKDVQAFIVKRVMPEWKSYNFFKKRFPFPADNSAFGKEQFLKMDLNSDKLTDLLIDGERLFAVTDSGNGHYAIHIIDKGFLAYDKVTLKKIIPTDSMPLLVVVSNFYNFNYKGTRKTNVDTLFMRYGGLYEYNSNPDNLNVQQIGLTTSECYGRCPVFKLIILADKTAIYNAIEYNDEEGLFRTVIDSASYADIIQTINYIKLASLKNDYKVNWTDAQTATLEIKFGNGQVKMISDYGAQGTYGLQRLYSQLFALRQTQNWK